MSATPSPAAPAVDVYEKLGQFYLGRERSDAAGDAGDLMLYDSRDLVTHGVVLGMTGSGKTGLCLALLEEAAIDGIPAIVIDPKGDVANLLLTFPDLAPEDFRPWINEEDALRKGKSAEEYAAAQAALWRDGLAKWGQDGGRIRRLRDTVDMAVYTPGSSAGLKVSILGSLACPSRDVLDDSELAAERVESTVSSLLGLLGVVADPLQSRQHLFLSAVVRGAWEAGRDLDLATLIQALQHPPFATVGVMPVESFYPEKDRATLALRLNALLASPGFSSWMEGDALDIGRMLHAATGKPRVAVFSIAHLGDNERMFFVSLLLNQMVAWMRAQSGTTSLRALLYMDEIFGFLPPSANPPSKKPMLTLLKQARAFGLGVLLASQNPVDLDYKALSNIGTWFLGRLQTERDKARVLEGLEGAAGSQGSGFDRAGMDRLLAALENRVFLMNNVHEDGPRIFEVRWVMSYLRGPLTRTQIKTLMAPQVAAQAAANPAPAAKPSARQGAEGAVVVKPAVNARVDEYFLPVPDGAEPGQYVYVPRVLRAARVVIADAKLGIDTMRDERWLAPIDAAKATADWAAARALAQDPATLSRKPVAGIAFQSLMKELCDASYYAALKKEYAEELPDSSGITVLRSKITGMVSHPGEDERDFRIRMVQRAREMRDEVVSKLRAEYARKIAGQQDDVERAAAAVDREKQQASSAKWSAILGAGASLLSMLFGGRKKLTATNMRRAATAGNAVTRSLGQASDVGRAEEKLHAEQEEVAALEKELAEKLATLERSMDPLVEAMESVTLKPLKKNITVTAVGLAWVPEPVS